MNKSGFTIIETMLFLAITGVLVVGILAGTGSSVNMQRYRDSVSTLKSFFEQQYSEVTTVRNEVREADISCNVSAVINGTGATQSRGQSDCVVLGRYLTINDNTVTTSSVVGNKATVGPYATDIIELEDYNLSLLSTSTENSQLEWGARIAWPKSGGGFRNPTMPRTIGILILRSPTSGLTYTFSKDSDDSSSAELHKTVIAGVSGPKITGVYGGQMQRRICVDSDGGFGGGLSVLIGAYASSASSIQIRSNDMGDSSTC